MSEVEPSIRRPQLPVRLVEIIQREQREPLYNLHVAATPELVLRSSGLEEADAINLCSVFGSNFSELRTAFLARCLSRGGGP